MEFAPSQPEAAALQAVGLTRAQPTHDLAESSGLDPQRLAPPDGLANRACPRQVYAPNLAEG